MTIVKRRKLQWYGHVSRSSGLAKSILQGTVKGGRRRGRQRKRWVDNIRKWTGVEFGKSQRAVENRENGENWLPNHLWCPNDPRGWGIDDDDDDDDNERYRDTSNTFSLFLDDFLQHELWPIYCSLTSTSWLFCRYSACWVCFYFHNPPDSDMDYRIFNVRKPTCSFCMRTRRPGKLGLLSHPRDSCGV